MSELNVAISPSGFVGVEKEASATDKVLDDSVKLNPINQVSTENKINAEQDEKQAPKLSPAEVTETVEEMNAFIQNMQRSLSFSVDEQSGQSVILVKDTESDEIIRQIPSEELVVLRKKMDDVVGILFDTKV
ncbi:flagellar protein FlaG [Psychromonas hadalis]|uniref:flagellar protein FlaG n=1 Tax=Psychromonas hadalis TaxID=211669 RepID=UPI0003B72567|nr:flagellar protein FlaG [Psychromonas hadalis]